MSNSNRTLFVCACEDLEHQLVVSDFKDEDLVYLHIRLNRFGFLKRLFVAIKYVLGIRCNAFEEIILDFNNVRRLCDLLEKKLGVGKRQKIKG